MPKLEVVNANNVIEFNPQKANFKLKNTGGPKGETGAQGPKGDTGPQGLQGPAGASASVTVGSTTTLSPGADATVTNSGDTRNAILNFGIPTGARGPKGDTGSKGDTGPMGPKGAKGDTGAAATVQVGNTNTGAPGTNAQVTNAGNEHFAVFNFTIPRGDKGEKGATGATGPQGPAGQDGTDGFSPIATVTQEGLDAEISITDKDGTTTATVPGFGVQVVESLPATGSSNIIYLERDSNSASGNPISIADAVEAPLKSLEIQGNTTQQTYTGKNLYCVKTRTVNGITMTVNADGSFNLSGTATATVYMINETKPISLMQNGATYTCWANSKIPSGVDVRLGVDNEGEWVRNLMSAMSGSTTTRTFTANTSGGDAIRCEIYVPNGTTVNISNMKIQLEAGSSATSFEPYTNGPAPNPDYPQAVQTVTGENVVKIWGKNLFDVANAQMTVARLNSGGTVTTGITNRLCTLGYIEVKPNTAYTLSATPEISGKTLQAYIVGYSESGSSTGIGNYPSNAWHGFPITFTTGNNCKYIRVSYRYSDDSDMAATSATNQQLELGSRATAYEPYQGQSYEVNLGKNLLSIADRSATSSGVDVAISNGYVSANGTVNASWGFNIASGSNAFPQTISTGAYTISLSKKVNFNVLVIFKDASGTEITSTTIAANSLSATANLSRDAVYYLIWSNSGTGTVVDVSELGIQIEKGSQATSYAAYFEPIELCKIGNYQDYIYKSGGKWYVRKEVGKIIEDGSKTWYRLSTAISGKYMLDTGITGMLPAASQAVAPPVFCSHFTPKAFNDLHDNGAIGISGRQTGRDGVYIFDNVHNTAAVFQTWLQTNPMTIYYVLATPTDTEITNEALIQQLEAILAGGTQAGANTIALTPSAGATGTLEVEYYDSYDSYLWVNNRWEKFAHLG